MDFGLSEEQELLQQTVRRFVETECPPARRRALFESAAGADSELWQGLVEMGIAGLAVPERFGGGGLELLDLALAAEEIGAAALPAPFFGHALAGLAIAWGGSEAQREAWLPRLASGAALGSVAFAESGERWQPEQWRAAARDGRLHAVKELVPHAAGADVIAVGLAGGGLALVEHGAPGVSVEPTDGIDRTRRFDRLVLEAARVDPLERGAEAAPRLRDAALVLLAADAFGAAWALLRRSIDYAQQREQFGTPLAQFQAIKHQLANDATALEPTRGLLWYAAHAIDHLPDRAAHAAAMAKAHIGERAFEVAKDAIEVHGGIGYTWESDVQIWFKRVLADRGWLGGPACHLDRGAALAGW